ncbi:ATP synthase subunit delta, mitochondrial-like [Sycon ciliatum]|uniref:ATP synthase subunit delta, mitochondrial-like n=1 Tax=Sycon ciliatum TaxID=27933 RepID=UPI0020A95A81|eukprot:scpid88639/ scgid25197/ ATP synthase subunit delta, mitochondrial; F-ATPase delta subunit
MAALRSVFSLARPCLIRSVGVRRMAEKADEKKDSILLTFGSPGEAFYNGVEVSSVDAVTMAGHVGLTPNHVPTLGSLVPSILSVFDKDGRESKYFVSSGGLTVNFDSSVQILAEEAVPLDQLDAQAIKTGAEAARAQLNSARSDREQAEAQINVSAWDALAVAVGKQ